MVGSRWAALSILNLLLWVAVLAVMFGFMLATSTVWLRMAFGAAFIALGFPLIVLAPALQSRPEIMVLVMIFNSVAWGTFWDWILRRFVDSPKDSDTE